MRRRSIAFLGVGGSILLLLSVCLIFVMIGGFVGWRLLGQDNRERLIRIIPIAPLTTPQAQGGDAPQVAPTDPEAAGPTNATGDAGGDVSQAQANGSAEADITSEEIEESLGFAIPEGAVNSVTLEGVGDRLVIPSLNLEAPIVLSPIENQTWKVDHLGQSVGHLEGTAAAGSTSNAVFAAHVTLSAGVYGPFAGLANLGPGDVVYVFEDGQQFQYQIDGYQIVDRTAIEVTNPTDRGQITLITCSNWDHNEERYIDRIVVTGSLIDG